MITQTAASLTPTADTRYSVIDAYTQARNAAARAARVKADCIARAHANRLALAKALAHTLRQTRGAHICDAAVIGRFHGAEQTKFWAALEHRAGVPVPASAKARAAIIRDAKLIAAGRVL